MSKAKTEKQSATSRPRRKKMALGRGLDALIPGISTTPTATGKDGERYLQCDINLIRPNPYQPRRQFTKMELESLSESITAQGIIQPLLVRVHPDGYELVAGERRLRAARMAGLDQVPVVVKAIDDGQLLEMAIVENIQRENFNPIEEADAYHRLMTEFDLTQEAVAERVGKSRSAVANFLRLRHLPTMIKDSIIQGDIAMGHARALAGMDNAQNQMTAWQRIRKQQLSVRQTEKMIQKLRAPKPEPKPPATVAPDQVYFKHLETELAHRFGTKVTIQRSGSRGHVAIEFYTDDDLDRLLTLLRPES